MTDNVFAELRKRFGGEVLTPEDPGYEDARRVWNGMVDRRPGAVARATSVEDVVTAVGYARDHDLLLSVRCGAHSGPGYSTCDGGLVLDLSRMNAVVVDPDRRMATVAGGALLGDLDRASQAHTLATTAGVVSHTGVGGLTLGGGIGRLHRKYGLSIDNVISVEVVTAAGDVVRASGDENAELFWGLRGAGHNFGVATSFEFRLHPVGPNVLAGMAVYPLESAKDVLPAWRDWAATLDDDRITACQLTTIPASMPFPPEVHGMRAALIVALHVDGNAAPSSIEQIASFGTPAFQFVLPLPYLMLQASTDEAYAWGQRNYVKGGIANALDDATIDEAVGAAQAAAGPRSTVALLQLGGAIARVPEDATAFSGRSGAFVVNVEDVWQDPAEDHQHVSWTRDAFAALNSHLGGANYVNLLEDPAADMRAAYGDAKYERLVDLKTKWDPGNLFRLNQNIPPRH